MKQCQFSVIPCPNKQCQEFIIAKDLQDHLAVCEFEIIECKFCHEKFERKHEEEHLKNECIHMEKPCPYVDIGCKFVGKSSVIQDHVENDCAYAKVAHLVETIRELKKIVEDQRKTMTNLRSDFEGLVQSIDIEALSKLKRKKILEMSKSLPDMKCKNCGNKFSPRQNHSEACYFHPGKWNFFNEQKWSCCDQNEKNSIGCCRGFHIATN
eukprot:Anaeramoba_ignava/c12315_g1_i1.p1 GENE.c12315_g1_i1~~c12315_g1_i1.p1  ORF type:complete len:210 (+),score=55.52 c12315_g1_i1:600-1229(+)